NIEVSQIPEVKAIEGSTANLECSYNSNNLNLPAGWYKWYRHDLQGTDIFKSDDFKDRITKESPENFLNKGSASIQLHRVTVTDTGMYFCEVEFSGQKQIKGHGKGTFLNVTVSQSSCTVYIVFGVLAIFSALLVSAYLGY
uniref:Natural cytotoxicity triggering receptor 3 n=1 Tax=Xenopus tropicalis TaxID=8364 RepID=A0A6I8QD99_XENTR